MQKLQNENYKMNEILNEEMKMQNEMNKKWIQNEEMINYTFYNNIIRMVIKFEDISSTLY